MFDQPKNPRPNSINPASRPMMSPPAPGPRPVPAAPSAAPLRPMRPMSNEPEDILADVEPAPAGHQGSEGILRSFNQAKRAAPPPNLGRVAGGPIPGRPMVAPLPRPSGAQDIFSDTDQSSPVVRGPAPVFAGDQNQMPPFGGPAAPTAKQPPIFKGKKIIILIISLIGLGILGAGGWLIYQQLSTPSEPPLVEEELTNATNQNAIEPPAANLPTDENQAVNTNIEAVNAVTPPVEIDSDLDGLTDKEERLYGTDINKVDTDGDSLSDRDEVKIYQTDPLNPDTDGDGYNDGTEVRGGYNPKGAGKLQAAP